MSVRGLAKAAAAEVERELGAGSGQRRILEMRMSEFATSGLVQEVKSGVLGEHILWVADNAEVPADNTLVVYRADELTQLVGLTPPEILVSNAVKEAPDGIENVRVSTGSTARSAGGRFQVWG